MVSASYLLDPIISVAYRLGHHPVFQAEGADVQNQEPNPRSPSRAGASAPAGALPGAAEELRISYKTMREAIERKQVRVVPFGGLDWVPNSEVERLKGIFAE